MTVLLLLACVGSCATGTPDTTLSFEAPSVQGVSAEFHANPPGTLIEPEKAFTVRELCPVIETATLEPDEGAFSKLSLTGRMLDRVATVGAVMLDGSTADSIVHAEGPKALSVAVGCRDCRLMLGFDYEGTTVACVGPGYSLTLERGRLVPPADQ